MMSSNERSSNEDDCAADALYHLLRCPDCKSSLTFQRIDKVEGFDDGILVCGVCEHIYPVADGIPILLRTGTRNTKMELAIFERFLDKSKDPLIIERINREAELLRSIKFVGSWEWDDVEFWDKAYQTNWEKLQKGDESFFEKLLPERLLQRRPEMGLIKKFTQEYSGVTIEVGAGTATYTKPLIDSAPESSYVAVDMSLYGLKIRRKLMNAPKSLYVLASIDNLPFPDESIDCMILIGILHHAEHKEQTLPKLKKLMAQNGIIYLDEVLHRPSFLPHTDKIRGQNISLHEEYIFREPLDHILAQSGRIEYYVLFNTPFYNFCIKKLQAFVVSGGAAYGAVRLIDKILMKSIGKIMPSFKAGAISVIWKRV